MAVFELGGWDVAEGAVEAFGVEPVDPAERGQLEVLDGAPGTVAAGEFGLVEPVDRLGQRVVVAVRDRPDRWRRADLVETFGVAHGSELGDPASE